MAPFPIAGYVPVPVHAVQPSPYLVHFLPNYTLKSFKHGKNHCFWCYSGSYIGQLNS